MKICAFVQDDVQTCKMHAARKYNLEKGKTIQLNILYEKLLAIDEQSFAKKVLILCLICFIYNSLQSFLRICTMLINLLSNFFQVFFLKKKFNLKMKIMTKKLNASVEVS